MSSNNEQSKELERVILELFLRIIINYKSEPLRYKCIRTYQEVLKNWLKDTHISK